MVLHQLLCAKCTLKRRDQRKQSKDLQDKCERLGSDHINEGVLKLYSIEI